MFRMVSTYDGSSWSSWLSPLGHGHSMTPTVLVTIDGRLHIQNRFLNRSNNRAAHLLLLASGVQSMLMFTPLEGCSWSSDKFATPHWRCPNHLGGIVECTTSSGSTDLSSCITYKSCCTCLEPRSTFAQSPALHETSPPIRTPIVLKLFCQGLVMVIVMVNAATAWGFSTSRGVDDPKWLYSSGIAYRTGSWGWGPTSNFQSSRKFTGWYILIPVDCGWWWLLITLVFHDEELWIVVIDC